MINGKIRDVDIREVVKDNSGQLGCPKAPARSTHLCGGLDRSTRHRGGAGMTFNQSGAKRFTEKCGSTATAPVGAVSGVWSGLELVDRVDIHIVGIGAVEALGDFGGFGH